MKSITTQLSALLLLFCVSWAGTAQAQDATVALPAISAEEGESVQVPVEVDGFDDVGAVTLVINYDSDVVTFDSLESAVRSDFQANSPSDGRSGSSALTRAAPIPLTWGAARSRA